MTASSEEAGKNRWEGLSANKLLNWAREVSFIASLLVSSEFVVKDDKKLFCVF